MPWNLTSGMTLPFRRKKRYTINEPEPTYQVTYLGNVLTIMAKGEGCVDKPLALIWKTHQSRTRPDLHMKLSVTKSGLKAETKLQGLTEYWAHRITFCVAPPGYPKIFCWIYKHEGKKMKPELRCHAVLCKKDAEPIALALGLHDTLQCALREYKREKISRQNTRLAGTLGTANGYPKRKMLLSTGTSNFRPPMSRSKSAPKLGMIEEGMEEDEEDEEETDEQEKLGHQQFETQLFSRMDLNHQERRAYTNGHHHPRDQDESRAMLFQQKIAYRELEDVNGAYQEEFDEECSYGEQGSSNIHRDSSTYDSDNNQNCDRKTIPTNSSKAFVDNDCDNSSLNSANMIVEDFVVPGTPHEIEFQGDFPSPPASYSGESDFPDHQIDDLSDPESHSSDFHDQLQMANLVDNRQLPLTHLDSNNGLELENGLDKLLARRLRLENGFGPNGRRNSSVETEPDSISDESGYHEEKSSLEDTGELSSSNEEEPDHQITAL